MSAIHFLHFNLKFLIEWLCVLIQPYLLPVIDDENSTVFTAGAIVTVTVLLKRKNLSEVFGDETYKDKNIIENDEKEKESAEKESEESKIAQEKPESEDQSLNKVWKL